MRKINFKIFILTIIFILIPLILTAEVFVKVNGNITGVNKYIWRGMEINKDFVIQTSLTTSVNNISFNIWGNMDTTDYGEKVGYGNQKGEFTEIDLTLSYSHNFELFSLESGIINYTFPNNVSDSTYEIYLSTTLNTILSPTLNLYYDIDEINGFYSNFEVDYPININKKISFNISSSIGYGDSKFNRGYFGKNLSGFVDFNFNTSIYIKLNNYFSITPFLNFSSIINNKLRNTNTYADNDNLYGGIEISFNF